MKSRLFLQDLKRKGYAICKPGGEGTPIHYLYGYVRAAQRGCDFRTGYPFQRPFLERGIKNCGSRLYLLLKIVADYEEAFI